jgi:ATP-dependent Clp protease ATP-binding subunit ClpA
MQQTTQIFTPDALFSLQNAQLIFSSPVEGRKNPEPAREPEGVIHKVLNADHIFRGSYAFIRETDQFPTFSAMLGLQPAKTFDQRYQDHYHTLIKSHPTLAPTGHIEIDGTFNTTLLHHKTDRNINQIDFCFLFYTSFLHLSNESQIFSLLNSDQINPKSCMKNCEKLLFHPLSRQQGVFAFLKVLSKIFQHLHLNPSTITTMHININDNLDALEKFLDSVESEIGLDADQNIDSNGTSTATKKKEEKKLNIEYFGTDLTKESKDGFIDPIIGREQEINQVIYTLLRKTKNNPLLIGEPGVGKTAIVEGLAQRIIAGTVPDKLKGKKIFLLDMGTLVAGTKYRGEFESRMKAILEEATDPTNNIILFIDELHTIIGAGGQEHNDAAQMLKPLLSRGKIKLIGATTFDEYQKVIEKDAALKRRFQEVVVNEPDSGTTEQIIQGLKQTYEDFHGVQILDEAISAAISLSKRYILNKQLPDKALDILDEACARESTMQEKLDNDDSYKKTEKKIQTIESKIEKAIENQDYFAAAELKEQEEALKKELHNIRNHKNIPTHLRSTIDAKDIGNVLAEKTGIPVNIVNEDEITKLKRLDGTLKDIIIGQDEAVDAVVRTLTRSRLSMIEKKKPIGSFLFL